MDKTFTTVSEAAQVTDEILDLARMYTDGWYSDGRIDWDNMWERMETHTLNDGTLLDLGTDSSSSAMRKIKSVINKERREG